MPACEHGHKHPPWPKFGPLVICPGERKCRYCEWQTSDREGAPADAKMDNGAAQVLRKHVYHEHTDGGKEDRSGVEVMLYRPGQKKTKGESMGRFAGGETDDEDEINGLSEDDSSLEDHAMESKCATENDVNPKPSLMIRLKVAAKAQLSNIDTQKAQELLRS
ncbi:hypothetical protein LTR78_005047 [Recurvomyces mirabilis]|uniref:Uncharacterized protein n=1 Tax=Recurvomyces mirabilis TaxID=574656 RepID=A0AAE0WNR1_9PEZI|nr:hypothetical protein LTR78_005047 [Recurvomyces mirabilis]KAK5158337.1 hypothetical protein LTS14_003355 [Recurvomyces mirabilis]